MSYLWQQQEYLGLSYQLHIDSIVAVAELSIVIYYILWCLLLFLVDPGIIFLLLPTVDIMSSTGIVTPKLLH